MQLCRNSFFTPNPKTTMWKKYISDNQNNNNYIQQHNRINSTRTEIAHQNANAHHFKMKSIGKSIKTDIIKQIQVYEVDGVRDAYV